MSLVIRMSPGLRLFGGYSFKKCLIVRGTVPMNDGMLSVACASDNPFSSVSTHAKSLDSRTTVENEVRTSAAAASSVIEMSRVHSISSVTALNLWLLIGSVHNADSKVESPRLVATIILPVAMIILFGMCHARLKSVRDNDFNQIRHSTAYRFIQCGADRTRIADALRLHA